MIAAIILTKNEEMHLERCIESIRHVVDAIYVVDSLSTDSTVAIAHRLGALVYTHPWKNYSSQFNWALDNLPIGEDWILRIDADEVASSELVTHLSEELPRLTADITGVYIKRRIHFMGKWIRHGGIYPIWHLRLWRKGFGRCEERWMDEHIQVSAGSTIRLAGDIVDDNKNNLTWWTDKHNSYATREAIDILNIKHRFSGSTARHSLQSRSQEHAKRWIKENVYSNLPYALRSFLYFMYRYFLLLGFLDGKPGLAFHFLQGFWYRFLVDAKAAEIEGMAQKSGDSIRKVIEREYRINLD